MARYSLLLSICILLTGCQETYSNNREEAPTPQPAAMQPVPLRPAFATQPVGSDPDDPAIWVHPSQPQLSLILGTDKEAAPSGGLFVYDLDGNVVQKISPLDRPNNVDVEHGMRLGDGQFADIAVVTERYRKWLRVYRIDPATRRLSEISAPKGIPVFEGQTGEASEPMGIALYRRPADGVVFAIVGRKTGPSGNYLWQYRLEAATTGAVRGIKVREFGDYSGRKEIEAIAVDDDLGYVYYADETFGVHKYHADPDHKEAKRELALFATSGFRGDHEGIAIYRGVDGRGFLICTDQIEDNSLYYLYRREGEPGDPHNHRPIAVVSGGADSTDGLDVVSSPMGSRFPHGLMVAMNSRSRNFLVYDWNEIAAVVPKTTQESRSGAPK